MADSLDDSAAPEGTKTFASRTSNKGKDENQGALAKNVITPLVNFAKTSAVFVANCKRPEDQRKSSYIIRADAPYWFIQPSNTSIARSL